MKKFGARCEGKSRGGECVPVNVGVMPDVCQNNRRQVLHAIPVSFRR